MAAYLIADVMEVTDPDTFKDYAVKAGKTIEAHGGRTLAAGKTEALEGDWAPGRLVVVEFDSMEELLGWYNSPEYQSLIPLRQSASRGNLAVCDGH